jgi:hypothetical protein
MPAAELVPVGAVYLPPSFTAHYEDDDAGAPDVALTFEIRDGVPECRDVRITATKDGHEVRHSGIVGVRIEDALDESIRNLIIGGPTATGPGDKSPERPRIVRSAIRQSQTARTSRRVVITDALLREVVEIYGANIQHEPTQAVADHFGKKHRTAALYVQRAREAGLLPPTTRGKAKA